MAPKDVITTRLNATHMNVSWQRLSLEEARGFVSGYFITFIEIEEGNRRKRDTFTVEVGHDVSYKVIGGLDLTKQYSVTVSGVTSAGEGTKADESTVNGKNTLPDLKHSMFCIQVTSFLLFTFSSIQLNFPASLAWCLQLQ